MLPLQNVAANPLHACMHVLCQSGYSILCAGAKGMLADDLAV
jgi:hypothetical protein